MGFPSVLSVGRWEGQVRAPVFISGMVNSGAMQIGDVNDTVSFSVFV